jgi:methionyl-tRNA synthetase
MINKVYRKELAGQLGNLFSRTSSATLNPSQTYPTLYREELREGDHRLRKTLSQLPEIFDRCIEERQFGKALRSVVDCIAETNRYFSESTPWLLPAGSKQLSNTLYHAFETVRLSSLLLQCVMPEKTNQILNNLDTGPSRQFQHCRLDQSPVGAIKNELIFPKL